MPWGKAAQIDVHVVAGKTAEDSYEIDLHGTIENAEKLADLIERWMDQGHVPRGDEDFTRVTITTRTPDGMFRKREIYLKEDEQ